MTEVLDVLKELATKGVSYCISVPDECGATTYCATPEDLEIFARDPVAIYAKAHGVTKAEYLAWVDDGYTARCAATTKSGKRCRNQVKGGGAVPAKVWLELQGEYCVLHGDGD